MIKKKTTLDCNLLCQYFLVQNAYPPQFLYFGVTEDPETAVLHDKLDC